MYKDHDDLIDGLFNLSWQEKVLSHLNAAYPSQKRDWKGILSRVYDTYAASVQAGGRPYRGSSDTATIEMIAKATGDAPANIARVLSSVAGVDNEKITLKHVGILEKISTAPARAVGAGISAGLKPLTPWLIPLFLVAVGGGYLYFYKGKQELYKALSRKG